LKALRDEKGMNPKKKNEKGGFSFWAKRGDYTELILN